MELIKIKKIPSYAIMYLMYDDTSDLTEEDIEKIEKWREEEKISHLLSFSDDSYFCSSPVFGLATTCYDCIFSKN